MKLAKQLQIDVKNLQRNGKKTPKNERRFDVTLGYSIAFFRRIEDQNLAMNQQFHEYDNKIRRLEHELLKATSHEDTER